MSYTIASRNTFVVLKSLLIVTVSILCLPTSVLALCYNYAALILCPQNGLRRHVHRSSRFRPRKVVITGMSTSAGLRVARALYVTGHNIVGIAEGGHAILHPARWSKAVSKFYTIPAPVRPEDNAHYAEGIFRIVVRERAQVWIDCSDGLSAQAQAQAKRLVEERSTCLCLVPSAEQIQQFEDRHGFHQLAQQLGLPSLESYSIHSRNDIYNVLNGSGDKKYLLSTPNNTSEPAVRTILPRRTVSQTYQDLARLKLSKSAPWTLEQYMEDLPQFTACAVVVQGKLKAFVASTGQGDGEWTMIPAKSGLSEAMKQYMGNFAEAVGPDLSSHLTMEFCLNEKATPAGVVQQILPVSGHLLPHQSLLLFDGKKGSIDLTKAYLAILALTVTELEAYTGLPYADSPMEIIVPDGPEIGVYGLYNNFSKFVIDPLLLLLTLRSNISTVIRAGVTFLHHLVAWQEALYDFGDPLPLFWYTHVFGPWCLLSEVLQWTWGRLRSIEKRHLHGGHFRQETRNGR